MPSPPAEVENTADAMPGQASRRNLGNSFMPYRNRLDVVDGTIQLLCVPRFRCLPVALVRALAVVGIEAGLFVRLKPRIVEPKTALTALG